MSRLPAKPPLRSNEPAVSERIQLARKLFLAACRREPTRAELAELMLDEDVDSLVDDPTQELPHRPIQ